MRIANSKKSIGNVPDTQAKMLWSQLRKQRYENVVDFVGKTGLGNIIAYETVRRAFATGERQVADSSLALIMLALEFDRKQIARYLKNGGDEVVWRLMGEASDPELTDTERKILEIYRSVTKKHEDAASNFAYALGIWAKAYGRELEKKELTLLGKRK